MTPEVHTTLDSLKRAVNARNEAELARRLGINQSTISSWKQRGRVPSRFTRMIEQPEAGAMPDLRGVSGQLQERAYPIGIARFALLRRDLIGGGDVDKALPVLRDMLPFWLVIHRAVHDMLTRVEELGVDFETAQALILQEDLRDPDATAKRIAGQVEEDLTDNPHLTGQ